MIEKTIHYVWFGEQKSIKIQNYIDNWRNELPDYKIIEWNEKNFDINSVKWVEQAVEYRKFAFASDYIRLWAVYNCGGIYLDTDVEVKKSFDDILDMKYFLGMNMSRGIIELGIFGAEQKCEWVRCLMEYYENKNFASNKNGLCSIEPNSHMALRLLKNKFGLLRIPNKESFSETESRIQLLPTEFFSPKPWDSEKFTVTKNTYTVHYFEKSWNPPERRFAELFKSIKYMVRKIIGEKRYLDLLWRIYVKRR